MASVLQPVKSSELDRLLAVFRENPKSTVFISLAQGYLAAGRAAEAIDVLNQGLGNYPDHTEARLLLGRSFAVLHRWKEAEAELVKVVKLDRYSQEGFSLLGEILVRRGNFDVAAKALQRAVDLDPTDERTLRMLDRARIRRPLDPPAPIPGETQPLLSRNTPSPFSISSGSSASLQPPLALGSSMPGADVFDEFEHDEGPTVVSLSPLEEERRASFEGAGDETADTVAAATAATAKGDSERVIVASSDVLEAVPEAMAQRGRRRLPRVEAEPTQIDEPATDAEVIASVKVPTPPRSRALATEPAAAIFKAEPVSLRNLDSAVTNQPPAPKRTIAPAPERRAPAPERRAAAPMAIATVETPHLGADSMEAVPIAAPSIPTLPTVALPLETEARSPKRRHSTAHGRKRSRESEAVRRRSPDRPAEPGTARSPEEYLNAVLRTDRVVHPERDIVVDDGLPIERWGHKVKHPFVWMWSALVGAVVVCGSWYLLEVHARDVAVRNHLNAAHLGFLEMTAASLEKSEDEATAAIARNPASVEAVATMANARAFALLVYGDGQNAEVETAIAATKQRMKADDGGGGQKELILARAAYTLAAINRGAEVTNELKKIRGELDQALLSWPDEPLLYWLNGLSRLASGDRAGAREALRQSSSQGLLMARIVLADMDLDEGNPGAALAGYDEALKKSPASSLAASGRAFSRAEAGLDPEGTLKDLEPQLTHADGKRAEGWARLALSTLAGKTGDPDRARTELDASVATGLGEPRFLARVALAQIDEGRIDDAFTTRTRVRAKSADPLLPTIDAELLLAGGRPDEALKAIGGADDARGKLIRGRALLDSGRSADAAVQLQDAVAKSGSSLESRAWLELAKVSSAPSAAAMSPLAKLGGEKSPTEINGLVGEGWLAAGENDKARKAFEGAMEGNPLAYRVNTRLADLALAGNKAAEAEGAARTALGAAPGYIPAHSALGRALVLTGKQSDAGPELQLVVDAGRASAADELAYAEAALAMGQPDTAKAAVRRAKEKGAAAGQLTRVATLIDPALASEMSGAAPAASATPAAAPAAPVKRKGR